MYLLTGERVIGGIVGVAMETMLATPSSEVPVRMRAKLRGPWGAIVKTPNEWSLNIHPPIETEGPAKSNNEYHKIKHHKEYLLPNPGR